MMTLDEVNVRISAIYPLTEKQFLFAKYYATHRNGMKAIRQAEYSHSTPGSQSSAAYRLLKLEKVRKAIELILEDMASE